MGFVWIGFADGDEGIFLSREEGVDDLAILYTLDIVKDNLCELPKKYPAVVSKAGYFFDDLATRDQPAPYP
ncbi:hypothetical protein GCM10028807_20450 [Spirosoma daeguense]